MPAKWANDLRTRRILALRIQRLCNHSLTYSISVFEDRLRMLVKNCASHWLGSSCRSYGEMKNFNSGFWRPAGFFQRAFSLAQLLIRFRSSSSSKSNNFAAAGRHPCTNSSARSISLLVLLKNRSLMRCYRVRYRNIKFIPETTYRAGGRISNTSSSNSVNLVLLTLLKHVMTQNVIFTQG